MKKPQNFADLIDQEIDFIGQLFVEYEQMTRYDDVLEAPDQIRSLASLFYDFVNRLFQIVEEGSSSGLFPDSDSDPERAIRAFISSETRQPLQPWIRFYQEYPHTYPAAIDADNVRQLYHQFPEITRRVAGDLRDFSRKLREPDAG